MTGRTYSTNGIICILVSVILLSGCASRVPLTTRMSDAVMVGVKPSRIKTVCYEYVSHVKDGEIPTCYKDDEGKRKTRELYEHNESTTLKKMINEYLAMKFKTLDRLSDPKIKVVLKDFWIEEYSPPKSLSRSLADILLGGKRNNYLVANLDLEFELAKDGKTAKKAVHVSTEAANIERIRSILESPSKKDPDRDKTPEELRLAKVMNDANNKAIIMLNQFLESNQL